MKFSVARKKKVSETHRDIEYNPKLSRRQNRRLRKKGVSHETY